MKIVYLHYHLKPGGVTTVIKQQINAVKDACEILVITGSPPTDTFPVETAVIPGIGYDQPEDDPETLSDIAQKIINAIYARWKTGCDIIHVHNPLLAKNKNFLKILSIIQKKKHRLFLQIHDFAEDGRPWSFYAKDPYPADCHYGVINSRDYKILMSSGLSKPGLHLISNMVNPFNVQPEKVIHKDIVLYPVRAIRRKNIGETLFLSLFFPSSETLAITLPPNSERDWKSYDQLKNFSLANNLNVIFEAADQYDFIDLIKSAKRLITTSITEGFGFAFLEPWTAGKALVGRNLPDICKDFEQKGIQLDHLYDKILIPITHMDIDLFFEKWKTCIKNNALKFNITITDSAIHTAFKTMTANGCIDFAYLSEEIQRQIILIVLSDIDFKDQILRLNPFLKKILEIPNNDQRIEHNRNAVLSSYNQSSYGDLLLNIYKKVVNTPVCHKINKQALAEQFLKPETFSLLKWNDDDV